VQTYIALIRKDAESSYGVDFPDFPGLVSGGETLEEALANAREGLAAHIALLEEDGAAIPAPRSLEAVLADPENRDAAAVLVAGPIRKGKVVRVNLTFDENLLVRIDQAAATEGAGRSGWLATLARQRLDAAPAYSFALENRGRASHIASADHGNHKAGGVIMASSKGGSNKSGGSKTFPVGRDSKTGQIITVREAQRRPSTTQVERMPKPGRGDTKKGK